jgi:hypothetical protein
MSKYFNPVIGENYKLTSYQPRFELDNARPKARVKKRVVSNSIDRAKANAKRANEILTKARSTTSIERHRKLMEMYNQLIG